jgi:hypothetical protein
MMGSTRAGRPRRLRIGIVFGGRGPEHEASLSSARAVIDGLDQNRYEIEQFGIAKSGTWLVGPSAWDELLAAADPRLLPTAIKGHLDNPGDIGARAEKLPLADLLRLSTLDCIFPVVHGLGGEDGSLQGAFLQTGRPVEPTHNSEEAIIGVRRPEMPPDVHVPGHAPEDNRRSTVNMTRYAAACQCPTTCSKDCWSPQ